ncbi:hypothetical protein H4582DRAFT_278768 [Lactarius indigo]|nr:hypothetical protein H4582DRAFT_278768 [Lactarius indigo]
MLLVIPSEEWTNVTRTSPSDYFLDDGNLSDSSLGVLSSNRLPSSTSLSSEIPDATTFLHTSEATPEVGRWHSSVPARARDTTILSYAESIDGCHASEASSRATSRTSSYIDNHATGATRSIYIRIRDIRDTFGVVAVARVSWPNFPATESKNLQASMITALSRILLYPWTTSGVTQTSPIGRTSTAPIHSLQLRPGDL